MPASPADIDVFEILKLQQYMRGYNSSLVQSDLRRIGLLLMYNRYYTFFNFLYLKTHIDLYNIHKKIPYLSTGLFIEKLAKSYFNCGFGGGGGVPQLAFGAATE
jgi:hypothetical protein